jgi:hypothetical protein
MKPKNQMLVLLAITISGLLTACNKDSENSKLEVRLTDAPAIFDEVNIDLINVNVNLRKDTASWINMETNAGVYNLLGLQNGTDTLIASATLPGDAVQEIRFVLGSNNSVKVGGVDFPLVIPSGAESGLKLKINKELNSPLETLIIDFDAALSIRIDGPGDYKLIPVLRVKE